MEHEKAVEITRNAINEVLAMMSFTYELNTPISQLTNDSLEITMIVMHIEDHMEEGKTLEKVDMSQLITVSDIVKLLECNY
jgi:acyl carrier protein